jgi:hypothetical protein
LHSEMGRSGSALMAGIDGMANSPKQRNVVGRCPHIGGDVHLPWCGVVYLDYHLRLGPIRFEDPIRRVVDEAGRCSAASGRIKCV